MAKIREGDISFVQRLAYLLVRTTKWRVVAFDCANGPRALYWRFFQLDYEGCGVFVYLTVDVVAALFDGKKVRRAHVRVGSQTGDGSPYLRGGLVLQKKWPL